MKLIDHYTKLADTVFGYDPGPEDDQVHDVESDGIARGGDPVITDSEEADLSNVARGNASIVTVEEVYLPSQLEGVNDEQWTLFVRKMAVAEVGDVSDNNSLGMFELTPRRLHDLGFVEDLVRRESPKAKGRMIWLAAFVTPMTAEKFLTNPQAQYKVFTKSMKDYDDKMTKGELVRGEVSRSGALAILHKCGPSGLKTWTDVNDRFPATQKLHDMVAGIF